MYAEEVKVSERKEATYKIPQYLHRPYQVLFFEVEELVVFIMILFFALVFGGIFWLVFLPAPFILSRLKKKYPRGYLKHYLYRLSLLQFKGAPTSFENEFYE